MFNDFRLCLFFAHLKSLGYILRIDLQLHLQRSGVSDLHEHGNVHKRLRHFNHKILTETCNENNGSVDHENM